MNLAEEEVTLVIRLLDECGVKGRDSRAKVKILEDKLIEYKDKSKETGVERKKD